MEFAAAALTTLASGGAGTAAAATTGFGSTVASILSGGATIASMLGSIAAGRAKADSYNVAAIDSEIQSTQELVKAQARENSIRRALIETLGERDVAAAASGVDAGFGTPAVARGEAIDDANRAISVSRADSDSERGRLLTQAKLYRRAAGDAGRVGLLTALGTGLGGLSSLAARG